MKKTGSLPCLKSLILLVEQRGIEPLTSALRTRRSAKLSYCPTRNKILHFKFATKAYCATDLQRISGDFAKPRCSLSVGCFLWSNCSLHHRRSSIHRQSHCGVRSRASTTRVNGICAFSFTSFTNSGLAASNKHMQCASPGTKVVRM